MTGALRLPQTGSSLVTGMGESLSAHARPPDAAVGGDAARGLQAVAVVAPHHRAAREEAAG